MDADRVARDFYNDTYLSDQNACTSPRVVVWYGEKKEDAKERFWKALYGLAKEKYHMQAVTSVDKLVTICKAASVDETENVGKIQVMPQEDYLLVRLKVDKLTPELMRYRGNSGCFYEYDATDLLSLREFCNDTHCQTLGYIGNREAWKPLLMSGLKGVDRVVTIGHTMDFDLVWDGYHLINSMTRVIAVR